jgi:hypothetical protein
MIIIIEFCLFLSKGTVHIRTVFVLLNFIIYSISIIWGVCDILNYMLY